jgi:hypothetical protein
MSRSSTDYIQSFLNHPILDAYLKMNLIVSLVPTTLVPLGILMAVYSTMTKSEMAAVQSGGAMPLVGLTDPLMHQYMSLFGISQLTALTLVPFAFLLGRNLFEKIIHDYTAIEEEVEREVEEVEEEKPSRSRSRSRSRSSSSRSRNSNSRSRREEKEKEEQTGGGSMALTDIPVLNTFLQIQGGSQLTPATLVPLGILAAVYHVLNNNKNNDKNTKKGSRSRRSPTKSRKEEEQQVGGMLLPPAMLNTPTLQSYLNMMGIGLLTPQTLLPFALIISKQVFDTYVRNHAQTVEKINNLL